jgi:hypothetical protein
MLVGAARGDIGANSDLPCGLLPMLSPAPAGTLQA